MEKEWIRFLFFKLRQDLQDYSGLFFSFPVSGRNWKNSIRFQRNKIVCKFIFFAVPVSSGFESITLNTRLWIPILFAGGDWVWPFSSGERPKKIQLIL
jgi:hypothetical protein